MARVTLMGLVNQNPSRFQEPDIGFQLPAFRYSGNDWRHTAILIPVNRDDRIQNCMIYDIHTPGCHPIWNNGRISGATMFHPHQAGLYAFKFPSGHTYIALKELLISSIRRWLEEKPEDMMNCPTTALDEAREFCKGQLPASIEKQMKAISAYVTSTHGAHASLQ